MLKLFNILHLFFKYSNYDFLYQILNYYKLSSPGTETPCKLIRGLKSF